MGQDACAQPWGMRRRRAPGLPGGADRARRPACMIAECAGPRVVPGHRLERPARWQQPLPARRVPRDARAYCWPSAEAGRAPGARQWVGSMHIGGGQHSGALPAASPRCILAWWPTALASSARPPAAAPAPQTPFLERDVLMKKPNQALSPPQAGAAASLRRAAAQPLSRFQCSCISLRDRLSSATSSFGRCSCACLPSCHQAPSERGLKVPSMPELPNVPVI